MTCRSFLTSSIACGMSLTACTAPEVGRLSGQAGGLPDGQASMLDQGFSTLLARHNIPGLAAGIIQDGRLAWAKGFGWADIENRRPMTADTVQNIGSVTKTLTTTLALQDIEAGRLDLDSDINRYLAFPIRNPNHPLTPITLRQILTHRSSIRDGAAYGESYRCGDQTVSLEEWLQSYFDASNQSGHFHDWAPGTVNPPSSPRAYSNVAFGLVGLLSERVAASPMTCFARNVFSRHLAWPLPASASIPSHLRGQPCRTNRCRMTSSPATSPNPSAHLHAIPGRLCRRAVTTRFAIIVLRPLLTA